MINRLQLSTDRNATNFSPKTVIFRAILILSTILALALALLLIVEGAIRLVVRFKYGVPGHSYGLWRYDKELGARQRENGYNTIGQTNNYGFRNDEDVFETKPLHSLRIIAYGGSTTYCYNLLQHQTWTYQLEKFIRSSRAGDRTQVLNAGGVNWSIGHIYARAKADIPALRPDYVLIYSGLNESNNAGLVRVQGKDVETLVRQKHYGVFATNLDQDSWATRNWATYKALVKYVIVPIYDKRVIQRGESESNAWPQDADPYILENYLMVLRNLITLCNDNHVKAVFIKEISGNNSRQTAYLLKYSQAGVKVASEMNAIVVDPSPILKPYEGHTMDLFYYTGVHYSKEGAQQFAQYLFKTLFAGRSD